jgi:hypothetical protein
MSRNQTLPGAPVDSRADFGGCAAEQTLVGPPPQAGSPVSLRPSIPGYPYQGNVQKTHNYQGNRQSPAGSFRARRGTRCWPCHIPLGARRASWFPVGEEGSPPPPVPVRDFAAP